ncbi:hypothetical protein VU04_03565 [Desulfobulbus sp. TB]|nr:hypothetical protein [Desulfobulbus sp. TB]
MEPVSTAIISGLVGGIATDAAKIGRQAVVTAYEALKTALIKKCGSNSHVLEAVEHLEKKPDDKIRQAGVAKEIKDAKVNEDDELIAAAEILQAAVDKMQGVAKYSVKATNIGVVGDNAHIEDGIHLGGK